MAFEQLERSCKDDEEAVAIRKVRDELLQRDAVACQQILELLDEVQKERDRKLAVEERLVASEMKAPRMPRRSSGCARSETSHTRPKRDFARSVARLAQIATRPARSTMPPSSWWAPSRPSSKGRKPRSWMQRIPLQGSWWTSARRRRRC
jgi:hypothetical protein